MRSAQARHDPRRGAWNVRCLQRVERSRNLRNEGLRKRKRGERRHGPKAMLEAVAPCRGEARGRWVKGFWKRFGNWQKSFAYDSDYFFYSSLALRFVSSCRISIRNQVAFLADFFIRLRKIVSSSDCCGQGCELRLFGTRASASGGGKPKRGSKSRTPAQPPANREQTRAQIQQ